MRLGKYFIVGAVVFVAAGLLFRQSSVNSTISAETNQPKKLATVSVSGSSGVRVFHVEVARSIDEQRVGLSGRGSLEQDEGMLFPFDPPERPAFWMNKMRFPIDIVWIKDGKIIGISSRLPVPDEGVPPDKLPLYYPPDAIDAALEVNAAKTVSLREGEEIQISFIK